MYSTEILKREQKEILQFQFDPNPYNKCQVHYAHNGNGRLVYYHKGV